MMTIKDRTSRDLLYRIGILGLLFLFILRVVLQALQAWQPLQGLPDFASWQSGVLPYSFLCVLQAACVGLGLWAAFAKPFHWNGSKRGKAFYVIAGLYFLVSFARLLIGPTFFEDHQWLGKPLPAFFHLVLSTMLLGYQFAIRPEAARSLLKRFSYPVLLLAGFFSYKGLADIRLPQGVGIFLPLLYVGFSLILLEALIPYRRDWQMTLSDLRTNLFYLVGVGIVLPKILSSAVIQKIPSPDWSPWPGEAPLILQVALVIVVADFLRYWFHRLSHKVPVLWRFHRLHHLPTKLHSSNVSIFHPIDKTLQLCFDTLPFLFLGVAPEVMAAYFVFYGIHGLFQHSNLDLRSGFLNHLMIGPQLHRWHHSTDLKECFCNFGNNIVLWDWIFGTRYLPEKRLDRAGVEAQGFPEGIRDQFLNPLL